MKIPDQIKKMPVRQLEAIYNNCWRNHHNDINKINNQKILHVIEIECTLRGIKITGRGGSFEIIEKG